MSLPWIEFGAKQAPGVCRSERSTERLTDAAQVVPWGDAQALAVLQRRLSVDILVTGHTHEYKVRLYGACFLGLPYPSHDLPSCPVRRKRKYTRHLSPAQALNIDGALLVNPGSATGAYSMVAQKTVPSFVLMDINGSQVLTLSGRHAPSHVYKIVFTDRRF